MCLYAPLGPPSAPSMVGELLRPRSSAGAQQVTSVLPKIIKTAFAMVHLIYFFTAGPDEVRGWCIRKGFKAPQVCGACRPPPCPRRRAVVRVVEVHRWRVLGASRARASVPPWQQCCWCPLLLHRWLAIGQPVQTGVKCVALGN